MSHKEISAPGNGQETNSGNANASSAIPSVPRGARPYRGPLLKAKAIVHDGAVDAIGAYIAELYPEGQKFKRIAILTTQRLIDDGTVARLEKGLGDNTRAHAFALDSSNEGTMQMAQDSLEFIVLHGCDSVLGIGGGSILDVAKVAAALATNGPIDTIKGTGIMQKPPLPTILMPTTAGTGSEATNVSVLKEIGSDGKSSGKTVVYSNLLLPTLAVIDPELTYSMSSTLTRDTGMDALCHAVESFMSPYASAKSAKRARKAVKSIMAWLPVVYDYAKRREANRKAGVDNEKPDDSERKSRSIVATGAHVAGLALVNSGKPDEKTGCNIAGASMSHIIGLVTGDMFDLPHGHAVGMVLVHSLELMKTRDPERLAQLSVAIGKPADPQHFIDAVRRITNGMEVPQKLPNGANERLDEIVAKALSGPVKRLGPNFPGGSLNENDLRQVASNLV